MAKKLKSCVLALTGALCLSNPALADLTEKHITVALKSVKFIQPKPKSGDTAIFVYKEGDGASKALAEQLAGAMDQKVLTSKVSSTANLNLTGSRLVFVLDSALSDIGNITAAAQSNNSAAIAAQKSCSEAGNCVITVETSPKVQIYLSASAAANAGVSFSNAFMMLVKKH